MNKMFPILALLVLLTFGCTQTIDKTNSPVTSPSTTEAISNAGSASIPYQNFNQQTYDQALKDKRPVYLEFSASWCPTCIAQEPVIRQAFSEMKPSDYPNLVAFKVDYDTYTNLKRTYGITYQHTHVLIDSNGKTVYKSNQFWNKEDIKNIMKQLVNGAL